MSLTEKEARALATRVAKESDGIVKFGRTNGKTCLHIRYVGGSETIYDELSWDSSPHNRYMRKKEERQNRDILEAVINKDAQ